MQTIHADNFNSELVLMKPVRGAVRSGSKRYAEMLKHSAVQVVGSGRKKLLAGTIPNLLRFTGVVRRGGEWETTPQSSLAYLNVVLDALTHDVVFHFNGVSYPAYKTELVTSSLFHLGKVGYCEVYAARYASGDTNPLNWQSFLFDHDADQYVFGPTRILRSDIRCVMNR